MRLPSPASSAPPRRKALSEGDSPESSARGLAEYGALSDISSIDDCLELPSRDTLSTHHRSVPDLAPLEVDPELPSRDTHPTQQHCSVSNLAPLHAALESSPSSDVLSSTQHRFVAISSVGKHGVLGFEKAGLNVATYQEEGGISLYSARSMRAREAARRDNLVQQLIKLFYQTCLLNTRYVTVHHGVMRGDWVDLHLKICKALVPAIEWDETKMRQTVELDWLRAIKKNSSASSAAGGVDDIHLMPRETFVESLTESVDIWSIGTTAEE